MVSLPCGPFHGESNWSMNGLSSVWALSWWIKWNQENDFSPVWVLSCAFKVENSENGSSQFEQVYGFSAVDQANGFSSVWALSWCIKWEPE